MGPLVITDHPDYVWVDNLTYFFFSFPTDVTVALADAGSTLSESEGASIDVCVTISQHREYSIDVALSYGPYGDKPGQWNMSLI